MVKFMPAANNYLADLLETEGAEAVVPDLLDFLLYCFYNQNFKVDILGFKKSTKPKWQISVSRRLKNCVELRYQSIRRK